MIRNRLLKIFKNSTKGIEEIGCPCENCSKTREKIVDQILQLIEEEVIGKDDSMDAAIKTKSDVGAGHTIGRNALRQEQRILLRSIK